MPTPPAPDRASEPPRGPALDPATLDRLRRAPKVVLHDHLDGGLRPQTVIALAEETGYTGLPVGAGSPQALGRWFRDAADSGSLERYLETFAHTVAVMQTPDALARVARECALDLAHDGVVHAEVRYAPELHTERGLTLDAVVDAVTGGFQEGRAAAKAQGHDIRVRSLLVGMRHASRTREIAELAVRHRDTGVAGFDIAGAETGFPPAQHLPAFEHCRGECFPVTVHAGESEGLASIHDALQICGADRLGHGVRIVDDITVAGRPLREVLAAGGPVDPDRVAYGRLAALVRDKQIPLELAPSSNVQTGAAPSIGAHPVTALLRLGFLATLNTDNRLMSGTSMTTEAALLAEHAGWTLAELRRVTINAATAAFLPLDERRALVADVVEPGYAAVDA